MSKILTPEAIAHYQIKSDRTRGLDFNDSHFLLSSHEELRRQIAEAQGQLKMEKAKVETAVITLSRADRCCPPWDDCNTMGCKPCWQTFFDAEAAKRVEGKA